MTRHPAWCAQDHRCSYAEHRSVPVSVRHGRLSLVISIVGPAQGQPYTELIVSVRLSGRTPHVRSAEAARLTSAVVAALVKEIAP